LSYVNTYERVIHAPPSCLPSNGTARCCSKIGKNISYEIAQTLPAYWAFKVSGASQAMTLTALAHQGPSLVGAMRFDPLNGTVQISGGMEGLATVSNAEAFDFSRIYSQLLFVESNSPLDQGACADC
jgi:hypothetical protein